MVVSKQVSLASVAILAFYLTGCGGSGPVPVKKENVHNLKDYITQKHPKQVHSYHILGETPKYTLLSMTSNNVLEEYGGEGATLTKIVLDDLDGYCKMIGGESLYGSFAKSYMKTTNSIENIANSSYIKKAEQDNYDGFFKCLSSKDGFEVKKIVNEVGYSSKHNTMSGMARSNYSRFYLVEHTKKQPVGYETKWLKNNPYKREAFADLGYRGFINGSNNVIPFSYNFVKSAQIACSYYGGKFYISNSLTHLKAMDYGEFLIQNAQLKKAPQFDKDTEEYFWCENAQDKSKDFQYVHKDGNLHFSQQTTQSFKQVHHINGSVSKIDSKLLNTTLSTQSQQPSETHNSIDRGEKRLAEITIKTKQDIVDKTSVVGFETSYNGKNSNGCDIASVKTISPVETVIRSYRKCMNGPIEALGRTYQVDIDAISIAYNAIEPSLIRNCKFQGKAIASMSEYGATAQCVKDSGTNNMKITVLQGDKTILIKHLN